MAGPNSEFTELTATTYRNHYPNDFADNVSKNNALLARMMSKDRMDTQDGGLSIVKGIDYAENGTYIRFSHLDPLAPQPSEVLTDASFPWRQCGVWVIASGEEIRINSGRSRMASLVEQRITNARRTFRNQISADAYSDGLLAKQVNGIQALISDTGLGTVGGIDSTVYTFWRNKVQSAAAPIQGGAAITPGPTTMESLMLPLYLELERGGDYPDLGVASNDYYSYFEMGESTKRHYPYADNDLAEAGFQSMRYKKMDVVHDGGSGIPGSHMYFINTDYLQIVAHEDAMMTLSDEIRPSNQDAVGFLLLMMWNLTVSNRALQGVLKA